MFKRFQFILFLIAPTAFVFGQRRLSEAEAVQLALQNQRNVNVQALTLQQQQLLARSAADAASPQLTMEKTPYEPLIIGFQQQIEWPGAYSSRRQLQRSRIELAQGSLKLNELEVKRMARSAYLELQYLVERMNQLRFQDSIYRDIKQAANRNFEAGQINKLDELFAASQADRITNELARTTAELEQQQWTLQLLTGINDSFLPERIRAWDTPAITDSFANNPQVSLLEKQVEVSQRELKVQKTSLLPSVTGGLLFPTTNDYTNFLGYQVGINIPIWVRQNKSRIAAANAGIEIARANQQNALQSLQNQLFISQVNLQKERASLRYFNTIALVQSDQIIETSRRLFDAGEIGYIESLRNITSAFETRINYLETLRNHNLAVLQINYLTGNL